jgi:hypothetical protein
VTRENSPEAEAEKVVRLLSERATAARAEAVWSAGTAPPPAPAAGAPARAATAVSDWPEPLTSTWNSGAIAALVIPALIVLIVWLL